MTELEQKLLDELETLEMQKEQDQRNYEKSLKLISTNLIESYQSSVNEILLEFKAEQQVLTLLLKELGKQQIEIIKLLKKPSSQERTKDQLDKILIPLFYELEQALVKSMTESNKHLIEELKILL